AAACGLDRLRGRRRKALLVLGSAAADCAIVGRSTTIRGALMANDEHVAILKKGVAAWNAWRDEREPRHPNALPDLFDLGRQRGRRHQRTGTCRTGCPWRTDSCPGLQLVGHARDRCREAALRCESGPSCR